MRKNLLRLMLSISLVLVPFTAITSAKQYEYASNNGQSFPGENEFYQQYDKKLYEEYDNAAYSVRRKISYKDVPEALMTFEKKTGRYWGQP